MRKTRTGSGGNGPRPSNVANKGLSIRVRIEFCAQPVIILCPRQGVTLVSLRRFAVEITGGKMFGLMDAS
jgi:hypothetical protein